ncbi:MAG: hypothetical protein IJ716_14545 [Lachnospiraceae bacterium]|nr:hypothetical protein [Lachnospiraceae bacterium]
MRNNDILVLLGAGALAYSIYQGVKMSKVLNKLGLAIDGISDMDIPEIKNEMINSVVQQAVEREVRSGVQKASEAAIKSVRNDISAEVQSSVRNAYNDVREDVKKQLEKQVGEVSIERVRREVVEKAKDRAAEKFESDLTDILQKYNDDLRNVSRIYSSIAGSLGQRNAGHDGLYLKL